MPKPPSRAAAAKTAPPKRAADRSPTSLAARVAELEQALAHTNKQLAELTNLTQSYIAQDIAAKMGPKLQEQLKAQLMAKMNQGGTMEMPSG